MGVHVALDHFGARGSSLATLTRLPIDVLKLDRSFLTRVDRDPQDRALCESVVGIGRALGVDVVAEGVETPGQLAALCGFACGFAQGFLISRPLSLGELSVLLSERAGVLWPGLVGQLSETVDLHVEGSLLLAHRGDEGAARRMLDLLQATGLSRADALAAMRAAG